MRPTARDWVGAGFLALILVLLVIALLAAARPGEAAALAATAVG